MNFKEFLQTNILRLDGGMGTLLQQKGLAAGEYPERWNLTHPKEIIAIHKAYFDAGSHVVSTNTFGANILKFSETELEEIITRAVQNARQAARESRGTQPKFVALDIGPSGKLLQPLGDLAFEKAVEVFAKTVRLGASLGVDAILIETMNDSLETKAALLAAKENSSLPVMVSNAYGEDGKLMTGADPAAMVALLEGMGADAIGANCSLGPSQLAGVAHQLLKFASVPVLLKPNAGLPRAREGQTVYDVDATTFAREVARLVEDGVRVVGGCCGTTPQYIEQLCRQIETKEPRPICPKQYTVVSSYTHAVAINDKPVLIGERINPTGKKRFKKALMEGDVDYILGEGIRQAEKGVDILDVNVGMPEICEEEMLPQTVQALQAVTNLPLQIDTASVDAMEKALRCYNGKAMINSVSGKAESMQKIFPLVQKYGGVVVALTLDENGIPDSAAGRVEIAEKILGVAKTYGLTSKDIVFDPLAMTVSADNRSALITLQALRILNEKGYKTSLGVSNISFGLPARDVVNGTFFALALQSGLSAAIMNPDSGEMMKTYYAYKVLKGMDPNCAEYIAAASRFTTTAVTPQEGVTESATASDLQQAILQGRKERAGEITCKLLEQRNAMEIVNEEIIPALNTVGEGFEKRKVYLPQLLMSAEAAKSAFESIKKSLSASTPTVGKGPIVVATVEGDIHDIGKNIVKLLLENYGFSVVDLGKDVAPETVAEKVVALQAPLVGLSALMTTTVPAMEKTICLLREKAPQCRVVVGGAVLTKEYADRIGADAYAKDAMETVRFAETIIK